MLPNLRLDRDCTDLLVQMRKMMTPLMTFLLSSRLEEVRLELPEATVAFTTRPATEIFLDPRRDQAVGNDEPYLKETLRQTARSLTMSTIHLQCLVVQGLDPISDTMMLL